MTTHPWTNHPAQQTTSIHGSAAAAVLTHIAMVPVRIVGWFTAGHRRAAERSELRSLDKHLVRNLGPEFVCEEACKRFWME